MADAFQEQLSQPLPDLDFESRLGLLIEREWYLRENRRLKRRLAEAKRQQTACMEDIDFKHPRGLNKSNVLGVSAGAMDSTAFKFINYWAYRMWKNLLGLCHGTQSLSIWIHFSYYRLPRLWHDLKIAKADGTYTQWLSQVAKIHLLILDDWGLVSPDDEQRRDLLEMLDDRYQQRSTIITSQLPTTHWHEHLNDATLADAILDRLLIILCDWN